MNGASMVVRQTALAMSQPSPGSTKPWHSSKSLGKPPTAMFPPAQVPACRSAIIRHPARLNASMGQGPEAPTQHYAHFAHGRIVTTIASGAIRRLQVDDHRGPNDPHEERWISRSRNIRAQKQSQYQEARPRLGSSSRLARTQDQPVRPVHVNTERIPALRTDAEAQLRSSK